MDIETIKQFIDLKRSDKFNLLLTIFSTVVSGFLIIFVHNPNYTKELSAFLVILLSLTAIAPIYIFNQILSVILISKVAKKGLHHLAGFANLPKNQEKSLRELTDHIASEMTIKSIYKSPARQISEVITIISCYLSSFISWLFGFKLIFLYTLIIGLSLVLILITKRIASKMISNLTPEHFDPLVNKLKKDREFMDHISKRLNRIEKLVKEKNERI